MSASFPFSKAARQGPSDRIAGDQMAITTDVATLSRRPLAPRRRPKISFAPDGGGFLFDMTRLNHTRCQAVCCACKRVRILGIVYIPAPEKIVSKLGPLTHTYCPPCAAETMGITEDEWRAIEKRSRFPAAS